LAERKFRDLRLVTDMKKKKNKKIIDLKSALLTK